MSDWEIDGLFETIPGRFLPCGLNWRKKLWWRFIPGSVINVRWPAGHIVVDHNDPRWCDLGGAVWVDLGFSADPNDHYRPWLEANVGRQGWDWDWGLGAVVGADNRLTIKIRRKHQAYATLAAMRWS